MSANLSVANSRKKSNQKTGQSASQQEKLFFWTESARGKAHRSRSGEIRARSMEHARYLLKRQGVQAGAIRKVRGNDTGSVPLKHISAFVRQLAVMLSSGVPLAESLGMIAMNMQGRGKTRLKQIVRAIRADVESGLRLSDSMRKHPLCFDTLFCNTLAAGEEAGRLEETLDRLDHARWKKMLRMRQRVRKALTYPSIVVIVAVAVTIAMLVFVIPTFSDVYKQFKAELPALTQGLLKASALLRANGLQFLAATVASVVGFYWMYTRKSSFRMKIDGLLLKAPIIGNLTTTALYARWNRTFATLNASGVPIVNALESVASLAGTQRYEQATQSIRQEVATGSKVSESMLKTKVFPPEMVQMIRIGEESGQLDNMLERLAVQYETKLDDQVENLSTVLEPMIMAIIGCLVGTLVIGMYLPIFNLGSIV
ncbi:MAG: type II secretion system F family protein [Limnobacter sp.]|nr:type II secretion system F family protein [Limnobacter sp.]